MVNKLSLFVLISITLCFNIYGQNKSINYNLSHPLKFGLENRFISKKQFYSAADTIKIIGILVQFQEDNTPLSTGNGKFDFSNKYYNPVLQRDTVIDAPPYDSSYFANHLLFLKNYFYKVSKGKLIIDFDLYGQVINLQNQMQAYSPQKNESNIKLGKLFKDSWARADSFINFSSYDPQKTAFVIFHSGTGRDIDLTSIFGFDPTPYDIPSVYLGLRNLKEFYGNNYNGYTTQEGLSITNSLIIPSTELRELDLISGKFLLQLGINGILAGSFGSYLGLPDLFNTQTGKTAIGRFGLMDGQSIFSYNGIFPPEPSAWEKVFLGWIDPITISSGNKFYRINCSSFNTQNDSTIYKVLLNSKEYFLIENRNRDPFYSGQVVYTKNRNFTDSAVFYKDVPGFLSYEIYNINGNVTDIKYPDWSLPGLINDTANFRGGILIWHIDENIIDNSLINNTINNNINHKGIDLEEAKGSQDIGVTINTPFGPITGDGSFVDFWYNGNHYVPSNIYKNQFTPNSIPNSLSYSLANNNIYVTDFDTTSFSMQFRIKIGSETISPVNGYPKYLGGTTSLFSQVIPIDINNDGSEEMFINNGSQIYAFKSNGESLTSNPDGLLINNYGSFPVSYSFYSTDNSRRLIFTQNTGNLSKLGLFKFTGNVLADSILATFPNRISTSPLILDSSKITLGFDNGFIYEYKLDNSTSGYADTVAKPQITQFAKGKSSYKFSYGNRKSILIGNISTNNSEDSLFLVDSTRLNFNNSEIDIRYNISNINKPIITDVNNDGRQEIIFSDNNFVYAINEKGIILDNFPYKLNSKVTSGFSTGDINNDNITDILFATQNGDLYALSGNGKLVNGFPILIGINTVSTPALVNISDTLGIAIFSGDKYLYFFKTNYPYIPNNIYWKNFSKDYYLSNNNFKGTTNIIKYSEKLPPERVYNWPNPVYDKQTFIRYFINGTAGSVKIKILDLSGEQLTTLNGTSLSNADNEVIWDVSNVQSGIYYGIIEAEIDGSTETRIIKIAVVK